MRPVEVPPQLTLQIAIRTLAWVVSSVVLGVLTLAPAAAVGSWASDLVGVNDVARLGVAAGMWAFLAGCVTVGLARVLLNERISSKPQEIALALLGGGIAAAVAEGGVVFWMIDHYGMIQSEVSGASYIVAIAMALLTSSMAAVLVTTGAARVVSLAGVVVATSGIAVEAGANLPGMTDGISMSGPVLMLSLSAAVGYAVLANYLLLRARRRSVD